MGIVFIWLRKGLLLLLLAGALPGHTEPLRVVLFDIAPYAFSDAAGKPAGRYVEIVQQIAHQAGLEAQIALVPFARAGAMVEAGAADLTISYATEQLARGASPAGAVLRVDAVVVSHPGKPIRRWQDMNGLTIGRVRGGCLDLLQSPAVGYRLAELNNFSDGVRMLAIGRLDGLCTTREAFEYYRTEAELAPQRFGPSFLLHSRDALVHVSKRSRTGLFERIRHAISRLQAQGLLRRADATTSRAG